MENIKDNILNAQRIPGRNSMGVFECYYSPYYLLRSYLDERGRNVDDFTNEQLEIMLDIARYAGDCFY